MAITTAFYIVMCTKRKELTKLLEELDMGENDVSILKGDIKEIKDALLGEGLHAGNGIIHKVDTMWTGYNKMKGAWWGLVVINLIFAVHEGVERFF